MYTYSQFQQQHPLSPKKFWKKMFGTLIGSAILSILLIVLAVFISSIASAPTTLGAGGTGISSMVFGWLGIIILVLVIYVVLKAVYFVAYIRRYYYDCNENFVTIKKGVFAPAEIHVQYQKIQDVYVDQDILDRIMGLYDVHIASATVTSSIEAHVDGVEQEVAEGIKDFLLDKIKTGGNAPTTGQASPQSAPQISPISFDHRISSDEYPIQGRWLASTIISNFFWILVLGLLLSYNSIFLQTARSSMTLMFYLFIYVVIAVSRFIWLILWRNSYRFEFMPEYILLRDGVISKEERHLPYKAIQNVTLKQGVVERLLGIGSVSIENAANQGYAVQGQRGLNAMMGSGIAIPGQSIDKANELLGVLNSIVSKNSNPAGMGL